MPIRCVCSCNCGRVTSEVQSAVEQLDATLDDKAYADQPDGLLGRLRRSRNAG